MTDSATPVIPCIPITPTKPVEHLEDKHDIQVLINTMDNMTTKEFDTKITDLTNEINGDTHLSDCQKNDVTNELKEAQKAFDSGENTSAKDWLNDAIIQLDYDK